MSKRSLKFISGFLIIIQILHSGAFALDDYRNDNTIDYMDRVYRFDTDEFLEGYEDQERDDKYSWYIRILSDLGIYPKTMSDKKSDSQVTYSEIDSILTSVILQNEDYAKEFNAVNNDRVSMYDALSKICSMLGYDDMKDQLGVENIAAKNKLLTGVSYSGDRKITFGEMSVLLWNAINSHGMERDFSHGNVSLLIAVDK